MNARIKRKWVTALRSGKYKQGRWHLRDEGGGYCCLGVLCDLYSKAKRKKLFRYDDDGWSFMGSGATLSGVVADWAGLDHTDPTIGPTTAISLNDDQCRSFKYIARMIEKYL